MNTLFLIPFALVIFLLLYLCYKAKQQNNTSEQITLLKNTLTKELQEGFTKQLHTISQQFSDSQQKQLTNIYNLQEKLQAKLTDFQSKFIAELHLYRNRLDEHQLNSLKALQENQQKNMADVRQQITETLKSNAEMISKHVAELTKNTDERLKEISGQVEKRLAEGFDKTTATFTDIVKRLALIDEAQKKITELSSNVVELQSVLTDKYSRGAFGEVQLNQLIRNMLPEKSFALQYELSNKKRADCILFMPEPSGHIVIDAKFPLENFRRLQDPKISASDEHTAKQNFRRDIRKHIHDIASKYIIPGETSDGAMMFIPAEAIFAELYAHYPDLIEVAYKSRVWLVSPTTMMAILNTARAVLKDDATRKQIHIIQEHLVYLSQDFSRFQDRMDKLAKHINQAQVDVEKVHKSSRKISARFTKIEQVEIDHSAESSIALKENNDNNE